MLTGTAIWLRLVVSYRQLQPAKRCRKTDDKTAGRKQTAAAAQNCCQKTNRSSRHKQYLEKKGENNGSTEI